METSKRTNIDFTRATLTILQAKYNRLFQALGVRSTNAFYDEYIDKIDIEKLGEKSIKKVPSKPTVYKLFSETFENLRYSVFLDLCELYENMPVILEFKNVELPSFLTDENHCAINLDKCPLPFFLQQAWFQKYDGIGEENRKKLCGRFNDFQRTNLNNHEQEILVGLTEISTSLVDEFLYVKRTATVPIDPKKPEKGYMIHNYTGFLTSTPVGLLMSLYHDAEKAPIHYLFRTTLNSIGGYFGALMLRQSTTGTKIAKTSVALQKYAHEIDNEPDRFKFSHQGKFFTESTFISMEQLEDHNHDIYHTVMHNGLTLPA